MPAWIDPPLHGPFPLELPERIRIGFAVFARARWAQDKSGVVAQYREERPRHSMHLCVYRAGIGDRESARDPDLADTRDPMLDSFVYVIDHVDEVNPDAGLLEAVGHLALDYAPGRVAGSLALGAVVLAGAVGLGALAGGLLGRRR